MARTMKAAVIHEFGKPLTIDEVAVPTPGHGEVAASGVCHTDLHAADGDWPVKPRLPLIPGHEGVGFVSDVGAGVVRIKAGDRVGVPWLHSACGHCEYCVTGWETLCESQTNTGYSVDGGYAEYVLANAAFVGILPDSVGFLEGAPILCAGITVYKGLKETETRAGEWVVISGIGGLGHLAVQYAKAMGLHVIAVDVAPEKLDLATRMGADLVVNAADEDPVAFAHKTIRGAHGALVTAVSSRAFSQALHMLRRKGVLSLNGLPPGDFPLPIFDVVLKRITVRGSIVGTRKDLEEALAFAADGKVRAHFRSSRLEDVNAVFARMRQGEIGGRIVLDMQ